MMRQQQASMPLDRKARPRRRLLGLVAGIFCYCSPVAHLTLLGWACFEVANMVWCAIIELG